MWKAWGAAHLDSKQRTFHVQPRPFQVLSKQRGVAVLVELLQCLIIAIATRRHEFAQHLAGIGCAPQESVQSRCAAVVSRV